MKNKYRIITILFTIASITIIARFLIGRADLNRLKEKLGQVSGSAIREQLRPLQAKHNNLSREEKARLSRMIRYNEHGPKKLEEIKNEYKKLPEHKRRFLNTMVKVYPTS